MTLRLAEIRDLAYRFVPSRAAEERLYEYGSCSWWPAHEIGHFLVATSDECQSSMFGIETNEVDAAFDESHWRYVVTHEIAAISISQRVLRRAGHVVLADNEIQDSDRDTLDCSFEPWCKRATLRLLRANRVVRLPTTLDGMEALLTRKALEVGTKFYPSARSAVEGAKSEVLKRKSLLDSVATLRAIP